MVCITNSDIFAEIKLRNFIIVLKNFIYSSDDKIVDQAILCLGNIIAESREFRDFVLKIGVLEKVASISKNTTKPLELIKNCMFLISNLLRGRPQPQLEKVSI
jgi:hypothetical protein